MDQIEVGGIIIDVIRKEIKNMHLAVYPPEGRVRIAAPLTMSDDAIRLFAISKLGWIKRRQRSFVAQERISPREYRQRESHYFQGRRYLLNIIEHDARPGVILRSKKYIDLYVRPGASEQKKQEVMTEWYRAELKKLVPPLIEKWEKILNVKAESWQIKQMKTQWGSCDTDKKRILLNLELAKKPFDTLEYIVAHEMVHLKERLHTDRFLSILDSTLPNWKQLKVELNKLPVSHAEWGY